MIVYRVYILDHDLATDLYTVEVGRRKTRTSGVELTRETVTPRRARRAARGAGGRGWAA